MRTTHIISDTTTYFRQYLSALIPRYDCSNIVKINIFQPATCRRWSFITRSTFSWESGSQVSSVTSWESFKALCLTSGNLQLPHSSIKSALCTVFLITSPQSRILFDLVNLSAVTGILEGCEWLTGGFVSNEDGRSLALSKTNKTTDL